MPGWAEVAGGGCECGPGAEVEAGSAGGGEGARSRSSCTQPKSDSLQVKPRGSWGEERSSTLLGLSCGGEGGREGGVASGWAGLTQWPVLRACDVAVTPVSAHLAAMHGAADAWSAVAPGTLIHMPQPVTHTPCTHVAVHQAHGVQVPPGALIHMPQPVTHTRCTHVAVHQAHGVKVADGQRHLQ